MNIRQAAPDEPGAIALLSASHELMRSLFPAETNHFLSVEALKAEGITFFLAEYGGQAIGCGALASRGDYGEVKSMFVAESARGAGIGEALLARIELTARRARLPCLMLETGHLLKGAHRLYLRCGFQFCGPFGEYQEAPECLFMEKPLPAPIIRHAGDDEDWAAIYRLVSETFAFMEDRIDPPSSIHRWTPKTFAEEAAAGTGFLCHDGERLIGCAFTRQKGDALYIGKLAVSEDRRGEGIARALIEAAEAGARRLGCTTMELQTRVELTENHAAFAAMGFRKTGETAHDGYAHPTSIIMSRPVAR